MPWLTSAESLRQSQRRAREWLMPVIRELCGPDKTRRIVSVGCGNGMDVLTLREEGYDAVGVEPDPREELRGAPFIHQSDIRHLPFADETCDLTLCLEVIEHVGVQPGKFTDVAPGHEAARAAAVRELIRVTKPGGHIVLTTPNKLFPIDEHAADQQGRDTFRWHSPWDAFTLSYFQIRDYADGACAIRHLSPVGYFAFGRVQRKLGKAVTAAAWHYLRLASGPALGWSPLNPHLFLLMTRRGAETGQEPV